MGMLAKSPVTQLQGAIATAPEAKSSGIAAKPAATAIDAEIAVGLLGYLTWCSNFVRRHPVIALGFALILVALVAGGALPDAGPYRPLVWILVEALVFAWGLATGVGYVGALARRVRRHTLRQRDELMAALTRSQQRIAKMDERLGELRARVKDTGDRSEAVSVRAERMERLLSSRITDLTGLVQDGKSTAEKAEGATAALTSRLAEASQGIGTAQVIAAHADATGASLASKLADLSRLAEEARTMAQRAESAGTATASKLVELSRLAETTMAERAESGSKALLASASMYNFGRYRKFNRTLTDEQMESLKSNWSRRLSVQADHRTLGYAAHRVCILESNMRGRLATSIEDITLRTMVGQAIAQNSVSVIEIGALFGIGAIAVVDALRRQGRGAHLTIIDPLEGYFGQPKDVITGQVVSEEVFRDNLRVAGVPREDVTIIKHLSTSADAIEAAAKREYDLLVIDGDHSYAGVKNDFELYSPFVRAGGFIVFDDYGTDDWPDVRKFVDTQMPKHSRFVFVGAEWRTAVFRAAAGGR